MVVKGDWMMVVWVTGREKAKNDMLTLPSSPTLHSSVQLVPVALDLYQWTPWSTRFLKAAVLLTWPQAVPGGWTRGNRSQQVGADTRL
ncbi:hypothetical protein RRG08_006133 [Elysia crispata]|uniref:Uncharacterized protein n=1 Tax=Elysia crispata TaxID=231223 RepID=A0AAE1DG42_9GAST|nr:hypothetical protein RRG08_006133 [Elysia crispata]